MLLPPMYHDTPQALGGRPTIFALKYTLSNHPVEGAGLHGTLALEISMSRLQCNYDTFVKKATNGIGMQQDKWIADEDWVHYIKKQEGFKDYKVSHMNRSISDKKCQFQNNQ